MNIAIPQLEAARPTAHLELDEALTRLVEQKQAWAELGLADKIELLDGLVEKTGAVAARWVAAACLAKGIPDGSPLAGEEWTSGPWALMYGARHYAMSLTEILTSGAPKIPGAVRTRPDGQVIAEVFPQTIWDKLLLGGVQGEVWMEPGVTTANLTEHMGAFYKEKAPHGRVALVLGAGNIASIGPMDVLYKLYVEGQVCIMKMNPVNEYVGPFLEEAFADFITAGYVAFAYGGVEVGAYLTEHPAIEEMHITGSAATHDAIVFGTGPDGQKRRAEGKPRNPRRFTSELGNVSPVIVVPGPWDQADLAFQAEHIATIKMHNGGFNCVAGQVLVMSGDWSKTPTLLEEVERIMRSVPNRKAYYPGAEARQKAALTQKGARELDGNVPGCTPRTLVLDVPATERDSAAFQTEAFGSVLSATRLPGEGLAFLTAAVDFCNDTLWGTLGCTVLIHPETEKALGAAFEDQIARLRYGCIAINSWAGVGFLIAQTSWGAFPGHSISDIRSGSGTVHNTLLFDRPQKSVIRQAFYPAPRGMLHGSFSILPKPPWFITNKMGAEVGRKLVEFEREPSAAKLPSIFLSALRG
ncbi:MAG: aldehyde dehydrogenase family protein [Polyangia bacterium]